VFFGKANNAAKERASKLLPPPGSNWILWASSNQANQFRVSQPTHRHIFYPLTEEKTSAIEFDFAREIDFKNQRIVNRVENYCWAAAKVE